jgi:adenylosuccinate synthase
VDGLKEKELGGSELGTTRKGIGPTYSSKASRSGIRVHHLYTPELFEQRVRRCLEGKQKRYGHFDYDIESELAKYKVILLFFTIPCVLVNLSFCLY